MPPQPSPLTLLLLTSDAAQAERLTARLREIGLAARAMVTSRVDRLDELLARRVFDLILWWSDEEEVDQEAVVSRLGERPAESPLIIVAGAEAPPDGLALARLTQARDLVPGGDAERLEWVIQREAADLLLRRRARELAARLARSERRARELVDRTREPIAFVEDAQHLYANRAYLELLGCHTLEELRRLSFLDLVEPGRREDVQGLLRAAARPDQADPLECRTALRRPRGEGFQATLCAATALLDGRQCLRLILNPIEGSPGPSDEARTDGQPDPGAADDLDAGQWQASAGQAAPLEVAAPRPPAVSLAARAKQESQDGDAALAETLAYALSREQLRLVYQPIVSLMGDKYENYSVLVRLLDEAGNLLGADDFVGPAIRQGFIQDIDRWTIRSALRVVAEEHRAARNPRLFINLAEDSFRDQSLVPFICDCIREPDARGNWVAFQFQEDLVAENLSGLTKMVDALKHIKCRIAINHFGVGLRPQTILQALPVDFVILAPDYADGLADDHSKQQRVRALANLAREFNVKTLVTGVEDARTMTVLWTAGVDYVQGNFLQRPSPTLRIDV